MVTSAINVLKMPVSFSILRKNFLSTSRDHYNTMQSVVEVVMLKLTILSDNRFPINTLFYMECYKCNDLQYADMETLIW